MGFQAGTQPGPIQQDWRSRAEIPTFLFGAPDHFHRLCRGDEGGLQRWQQTQIGQQRLAVFRKAFDTACDGQKRIDQNNAIPASCQKRGGHTARRPRASNGYVVVVRHQTNRAFPPSCGHMPPERNAANRARNRRRGGPRAAPRGGTRRRTACVPSKFGSYPAL